MAEYKRLITYAYNYESGQRRQNVGHARVEVSGSDVKIKFDIKVPSLSGKQLTIYFYKRIRGGIQLVSFGEISVVNGIADQKLSFTSKNLGNTSLNFDEVNGFILYYNSSKSIVADWKDLSLSREDLACVENPITKWVPKEEPEVKVVPLPEEKKDVETSLEAAGVPMAEEAYDAKEALQGEESRKEEIPSLEKLQEAEEISQLEKLQDEIQQAGEDPSEVSQEADPALNEEKVINELRASETEEVESEKGLEVAEEVKATEENEEAEEVEAAEEIKEAEVTKASEVIEGASEPGDTQEAGKEEEAPITEDTLETKEPQADENSQGVSASSLNRERDNKEAPFPWRDAPAASKILGSFPRVYPFEDGEIAECVKIEPKNIGLLPMEFWHLGNNSFLVHSFCNYHHLLFAKKQTRTGCLYLLMVPGVYNPREKYMARMFGFEYFKCAKRRNARDGEFGYWYVTIHF